MKTGGMGRLGIDTQRQQYNQSIELNENLGETEGKLGLYAVDG
jgi:hypothetical protein